MQRLVRIKYHFLRLLSKLLIILLLIPLAYNFIPIQQGKSTFYLPKATNDSLIATLQEHGYSVYDIDKIMLNVLFDTPQKGWYRVPKIEKERFEFFKNITKEEMKTIRIKIYGGENSEELTKRLAKDLNLNPKKLLKIYKEKSTFVEADILSGFYIVSTNADEASILSALFAMSEDKLNLFSQQYTNSVPNDLELKVILIIASIIQKETYNSKEMSLISSVIQNRLEKNMRLQMDGTLNYGKYSHKVVTSSRIKTDMSYYNTYKHKGLPPAPLCTVSIQALEASFNPKKTNYLYFMLNKKGTHDFASSYKEHKKNIKAFKYKPKKVKKIKKVKKPKKIKKVIEPIKSEKNKKTIKVIKDKKSVVSKKNSENNESIENKEAVKLFEKLIKPIENNESLMKMILLK